ncbi:MAG TPA: Flp pilus assembly protein CpaB [Acidimicrobiales bacterium]|nr:Flp pilus assembly protein CpaB [Acidimicrobiales bacterium]
MRLRRVTRSPFAFWIAVAVLAVITWSVVAGIVGRAQAQAEHFGSLRDAAVATRPVAAGALLGPDDVVIRSVPAAFLPEASVAALSEVLGRTVLTRLFPGQAVVREQFAPFGLEGVAALLPPGARAVAVPTGGATAPLRKGDVVDVLATFDPAAPGAAAQEPTFAVATNAVVVDVGGDAATVAVGPEEAKRVAFAVTQATVTLAVGAPGDAQRAPVATSTSTPRPTIAR